jgi:putative transposase
MPRGKRDWRPGGMYHITARGIRRLELFRSKEDYLYYLSLLEKAKKRTPFILHTYCLMSNHVHLLIETINHSPAKVFLYVHSMYARYFNKKYGFVGHVFQGRYHAKLITDWKQMIDTSRYIHLNPVKAKITTKPEKYPWSSYKTFISSQVNPLVDPEPILSRMNDGSKKKYKFYVEINMKSEPIQRASFK